jgi:predicted cupin superfamily sugar epimerase
MDAKYFISKLNMLPHPEGGYFKEFYKSNELIKKEHLPDRFGGHRAFSTSIYFLLNEKDVSKLHKIESDELWYYHSGSSVTIICLHKDYGLKKYKLGLNLENEELPQVLVEKGTWFGAFLNDETTYSLVGCNVAPGFDFEDFVMGDKEKLFSDFPKHKEIIIKLT